MASSRNAANDSAAGIVLEAVTVEIANHSRAPVAVLAVAYLCSGEANHRHGRLDSAAGGIGPVAAGDPVGAGTHGRAGRTEDRFADIAAVDIAAADIDSATSPAANIEEEERIASRGTTTVRKRERYTTPLPAILSPSPSPTSTFPFCFKPFIQATPLHSRTWAMLLRIGSHVILHLQVV